MQVGTLMDKPKVGLAVFMTDIRDCLHDTCTAGPGSKIDNSLIGSLSSHFCHTHNTAEAGFENNPAPYSGELE